MITSIDAIMLCDLSVTFGQAVRHVLADKMSRNGSLLQLPLDEQQNRTTSQYTKCFLLKGNIVITSTCTMIAQTLRLHVSQVKVPEIIQVSASYYNTHHT